MTGPRIAPVHVEFWQAAKALPRFANGLQNRSKPAQPRTLIDRCVNAHAGLNEAKSKVKTANTCALIRASMEREPARNILARMAGNPFGALPTLGDDGTHENGSLGSIKSMGHACALTCPSATRHNHTWHSGLRTSPVSLLH